MSYKKSHEEPISQPGKPGSFAQAVFDAPEGARDKPSLTSDLERTFRNVRRFELKRDLPPVHAVASAVEAARRKPGPKGVTDGDVSAAADFIWQQGKGPVPTVKAVQAELRTGSTVKVGSSLIEWSIRNGLTLPPPPIPAVLGKSINDYLEDARKKTAKESNDVLDASRQDNLTALDALREAESQIEELLANVEDARVRRDENRGAMLRQDEEILRNHQDLVAAQERLIPIISKSDRLEYERDSLLERLNETQCTLDAVRRKMEALSAELVRAQIDVAKTNGELEGLMLKSADADRSCARNTALGAGS